MKNFLEDWGPIIAVIAIFFLGLFFYICVSEKISEISCEETSKLMQFESYYSMRTGCMIKIDGRWSPLKSYKVLK